MIDFSHPKDMFFFKGLSEELVRRGHQVLLIGRKYGENESLAKKFGWPVAFLGQHGETLKEKAYFGIERMRELFKWLNTERIDGLISLANPESVYVCYRLGIPIFTFIDIPEAKHACTLTLPLSTVVFTPFCVPREALQHYGATRIFQYNCLDSVAWMPKEPAPREELGVKLDWDKKVVVYREAEVKASYFNRHQDLTRMLIKCLKANYPDIQFCGIPRYRPHKWIDVQSLLCYADVLISGGGTMTQEAAWWGTWAMSTRPSLTYYDRWMVNHNLMDHVKNVRDGVTKFAMLMQVFKQYTDYKNPNRKLLREMSFPTAEIVSIITGGGER